MTLHPSQDREALQQLATAFAMPCWDTAMMAAQQPRFDRLPLVKAQQRGVVLLQIPATDAQPSRLIGVHSDPFNSDLITWLEHLAEGSVEWVLATEADLHAYLSQQESQSRAIDALAPTEATGGRSSSDSTAEVLSLATLSDTSSPTVKLVNSTLYDALRSGASDVHFESTAEGLTVKYRIDGMLDTVTQVPGSAQTEQVMSRLKVLAELDIAEQRVPQDGSFRVSAQGRDIDLRVSIMPSVHGEDAVIRILDKQAILTAHGALTLDALGFDAHALGTLRELMKAPYGMMLVTGPTGSGKTTTLYAVLSETRTGHDKVITIEDPVEYQLPGVLQIPVNEKKGLTFARGLRSILRHDPDKIMIGEIRDRETAEIAVQSALTGHQVLTTVHANNVFDVFGRFTHMGLDPYALASALNGVWAQRLLRVNCPRCRRPDPPDLSALARLAPGTDVEALRRTGQFLKGQGCGDCRGTGYKGRRAVAEILRLDDEMRELLLQRASVRQMKTVAYQKGARPLSEAALALAVQGVTTLDEVLRVTVAI
jgi:general secretion pathway protein E